MIKKANLMGMVAVLSLAVYMLSPASAALVTYDVSFTASNFMEGGAPQDPVTGEFTLTFDATQYYQEDVTAGVTLKSLNINLGSPLAFTYPVALVEGEMNVGGLQNSSLTMVPGTDDFLLDILNFTTNPYFNWIVYSQKGAAVYNSFSISGTVTGVPAVPLPLSVLLLGSGLLGLAGWRRSGKG